MNLCAWYRQRIYFITILLIPGFNFVCFAASAQNDTLTMRLDEAEKLFLQKNFLLLAAKYQVSVSDAAVIQARLYPNPNLSVDQGAYNRDTKKIFDLSKTGETAASLQQVILLSGKINKQVSIAKSNAQIATYQFYDLIRTLRYQLRSSFYSVYYLQRPLVVYDKEIESLKTLITVYTTQYNKGNIAFKEVARLQALEFSLQNERLELLKQLSEKESDVMLLTGDTLSRPIKPAVDTEFIKNLDASNISYIRLLDSALINRYDLKAANAQVELSKNNLALQRSLRVPDLTLGANYDKAGSYVRNYNSISLAVPLPLWNRNQGNIKAAQFKIEESKQQQLQVELQAKNDIRKAYVQLLETDKLYKTASLEFNADYEKLLDGIIKGYQNHTISLLEFIDYYETYKNSALEFNRLQNNRLDALENLNLATGTIILQ